LYENVKPFLKDFSKKLIGFLVDKCRERNYTKIVNKRGE